MSDEQEDDVVVHDDFEAYLRDQLERGCNTYALRVIPHGDEVFATLTPMGQDDVICPGASVDKNILRPVRKGWRLGKDKGEGK